jgi:hypothetical protein
MKLMIQSGHRELKKTEGALYGPHAPFSRLKSRNKLFVPFLQMSKLPGVIWDSVSSLHWSHDPVIKAIGASREGCVADDTITGRSMCHKHLV